MNKINYNDLVFFKSIDSLYRLPDDIGREIVFIGKSNSGKSSILNKISNNSRLCKTGKIAGSTKLVNIFKVLNSDIRFIDFPGYGYASFSKNIKVKINKFIRGYLKHRLSLRGIIFLMDIRGPLSHFDINAIKLFNYYNRNIHIVLSKSDKLNNEAIIKIVKCTNDKLIKKYHGVSLQPFSIKNSLYLGLLHKKIDSLLA